MPGSRPSAAADARAWQQEFQRQLFGIKSALHSLKLQTDSWRERHKGSKALQSLQYRFEMVQVAFDALNSPEPEDPSGDFISGDFIPSPTRKPKTLDEALGLEK